MNARAREGAVLGIDPGTRKCGFALVVAPLAPPLELGIVATEALEATVRDLTSRYAVRAIALGAGTHATAVGDALASVGVAIELVDERATTLLARARYFDANPPRGWRRLVPRGMLLPSRPIDDYAALLIAERLLASESASAP